MEEFGPLNEANRGAGGVCEEDWEDWQKHMNSIHRDIFKAIHEGKWLKIEYLNKEGKRTNYWIGIRDLDPRNKTLKVDGLHLNRCSIEGYDKIYIDSILSTEIVEGLVLPGE